MPFIIEDMTRKSPKNRFERLEFDRFFVCQSAGIVQRRLAKDAEAAEATGHAAVRRPKTRSDDKTFLVTRCGFAHDIQGLALLAQRSGPEQCPCRSLRVVMAPTPPLTGVEPFRIRPCPKGGTVPLIRARMGSPHLQAAAPCDLWKGRFRPLGSTL